MCIIIKDTCTNDHNNTLQNSRKLETTQVLMRNFWSIPNGNTL